MHKWANLGRAGRHVRRVIMRALWSAMTVQSNITTSPGRLPLPRQMNPEPKECQYLNKKTFYDYGLCVLVVRCSLLFESLFLLLAETHTPVIGNFTRHIICIRIRSIIVHLNTFAIPRVWILCLRVAHRKWDWIEMDARKRAEKWPMKTSNWNVSSVDKIFVLALY